MELSSRVVGNKVVIIEGESEESFDLTDVSRISRSISSKSNLGTGLRANIYKMTIVFRSARETIVVTYPVIADGAEKGAPKEFDDVYKKIHAAWIRL